MPTAWRIVKSARASDAFDGEGARIHGGRWSSPGTAIVYTAQSESLAALELLVHLQASHLLASYSSISATFDEALIEVMSPTALPADWRSYPAPAALAQIGDSWAAERRSAILQVPSAVVPNEMNFLVNPAHADFARIRIGRARPFEFDPRLE
jgi:RES domain-containing protein